MLSDPTYETFGRSFQTYQSESDSAADWWMRVFVGDVKETQTSVSVTVGVVFKAYACYNLVFREIGVYGRDESGNDVGSPCYADYCTIGENGDQMTQGAGQGGVWFSERTYTVSKPAGKKIALFPYIKIGGLVSGTSDYTAGNFWMWGNGWGCLRMLSGTFASKTDWYGMTATFNGVTKSIPCCTRTNSNDRTCNLSYSNALPGLRFANIPPKVWYFSPSYKQAKKVTVYNSSGKACKAKKITVYNSSGKAVTSEVSTV